MKNVPYYVSEYAYNFLIPGVYFKNRYIKLKELEKQYDVQEIAERVNYYAKVTKAFTCLAYREDRVLVCDGGSGLKIIDVTDKKAPKVVGFIDDIDPRDIILIKDHAYVVTKDGMVIYSISDLENPQRLSIQNL